MTLRHHQTRNAFTLVELIGVIVILAVLAGAVSPLLVSAARAHSTSVEQRSAAASIGGALERIVRILRETPSTTSGAQTADITIAEPTRVALGDGHAIELVGNTLQLTAPGETAATLCADVTLLELTYLGEDGVTDVSATPDATHRVQIHLAAGGVDLKTCAFLRISMETR